MKAVHVDRYEKAWIGISVAFLAGLVLVIAYTVVGMNIHLPGSHGAEGPDGAAHHDTVPDAAPEAPGVYEVGPNHYRVVMTAQVFAFDPNEIRLPRGARVDFVLTSKDVIHGFFIPGTTVNTMVIPGQVTRTSYVFKRPGSYTFFCHEYCGIGHQVMAGHIQVD